MTFVDGPCSNLPEFMPHSHTTENWGVIELLYVCVYIYTYRNPACRAENTQKTYPLVLLVSEIRLLFYSIMNSLSLAFIILLLLFWYIELWKTFYIIRDWFLTNIKQDAYEILKLALNSGGKVISIYNEKNYSVKKIYLTSLCCFYMRLFYTLCIFSFLIYFVSCSNNLNM